MQRLECNEFSAQRCPAVPVTTPTAGFTVYGPGEVGRDTLEARIHSGYGTHFGATIKGFMPRLLHYRHADGASAVIGIRKGTEGPLLLESYLAGPVDGIIACLTGAQIDRALIAEVGQFVVDDRRIVPDFFHDLVGFLVQDGFEWVCFTGTHRVRAILERTGFLGLPVGIADANLVPSGKDTWGDYYENEPVVILGKLDDPQGNWCRRFEPPIPGIATEGRS